MGEGGWYLISVVGLKGNAFFDGADAVGGGLILAEE
jgi:hypothetical protein